MSNETKSDNLTLRFLSDNGRKYNIRVKNPKANLTASQIQNAANGLISNKIFDFDGAQGSYSLDSATLTNTDKVVLVSGTSSRSRR